jgi:hypothetical protein
LHVVGWDIRETHTATPLPSQESCGEEAHCARQAEDGGKGALAGPGGGEAFGSEHEGRAHGADAGAEDPVFAAGVAEGAAPVSIRFVRQSLRGGGNGLMRGWMVRWRGEEMEDWWS